MTNHIIKIIIFMPLMLSSMQNPGLSELRCFSLEEQNALKEFAQKLVLEKAAAERLEKEQAEEEAQAMEKHLEWRIRNDEKVRKENEKYRIRCQVDKEVLEQMPIDKIEAFQDYFGKETCAWQDIGCCSAVVGVATLYLRFNSLKNSFACYGNDDISCTAPHVSASLFAACSGVSIFAYYSDNYSHKRERGREALRDKLLKEKME